MYKGILTIPNNVTIIKSEEYSDNLEINELRFEEPSNLKKIEDRSFANCLNLHTIQSIPPSVTVLENGAFLGCSGLLKVTLAQRHVQDELTFIDKNNFRNPFWGCGMLQSIELSCTIDDLKSDSFLESFKHLISKDNNRIIPIILTCSNPTESVGDANVQIIIDKKNDCSKGQVDGIVESLKIIPDGCNNYMVTSKLSYKLNFILSVCLLLSLKRMYRLKYRCLHEENCKAKTI